ncbi:hypothetical protein HDU77_009648, partial [Chytriomyces hyalinus]
LQSMYRIVRTAELRTWPDTNEALALKEPTRILVGLIQFCPGGVRFVDGSEPDSEELRVTFHMNEELARLDGARVAILRWILVHGACSRSLAVFEYCMVSSEWENSVCSFLVSHESLNRSNLSASLPRLFRQNTAIRLNESLAQLKTFNAILLSLDSDNVDHASLRRIKRASLLAALVSKTCIFSLKSMRFFVATFQCLTFPTSNITVQVLFEQSLQPRTESFIPCNHITTLHNQLQILQPYLLTNLDAKQIKFLAKPPNPNNPKSNQTRLLTFHPLDSRIYPLDAVLTDSFCKTHSLVGNQKIEWNRERLESDLLKSPSASPVLIASYTGKITNVLDPLVGKFQLDDKHDFYVTCAPLPPEIESLLHIPGVMISIFNVHVIVLESCDLTLDAGNRAVMVACLGTTVDIVDVPGHVFSSNSRNIPSLKDRAELRKRWGSFNLMDMVLLDDLYQTILRVQDSTLTSPGESTQDPTERVGIATGAFELSKALLRKFPEFKEKADAEALSSTGNSKNGDALTGCGEMATLNLALMHDSVCQAVVLRYTRMYRISLEMVLQSTGAENDADLEDDLFEAKSVVTAFIDSVVDGRHQNASGGYACGVFGLEDLGLTNCFLVGLLESRAGCLWFRDSAMVSSTDGIPLHIVSDEHGSQNESDDALELADLRNCVAILKFELVVEVIGWHTNSDARRWGGEGGDLQEPLVRKYIKCQSSDILFKKLPRATAVLAANETKIDGRNGLRDVVLRVDHINIPALSFKIDGYEISGRMYGCGWSLSSRDTLTEVELFHEVAVCNLTAESLFIYPFLKAGGVYLLSRVKMVSFGGDEFDKLHNLFVQTTPSTVITPIRIINIQGSPSGHIDATSTQTPSLNLPQKQLPPVAVNSTFKSFAVHQLLHSQQNNAPQPHKKLLPELVNLKARILSKQLVKTSPHQLHDRLPAIHLFEQVHVGLGSFDTQFLLTVGDVSGEGSGTMQIYWDARVQVFSSAVIPGAIVQFNKLGLRVAGSGVYGQTVSETWIQVLSNDRTDAAIANRQRNTGLNVHTLPRAFLAKFWERKDSGGGGAFEFHSVRCCVTHIEEVRLWSECARCRVKSFGFGRGSLCGNKCKGADRIVQGNAKCFIEDGSSDALVYLEGIQAVAGLLSVEAGSAGRLRLDDAVIGVNGASDVIYYEAPPWFGEEDMFGKQDAHSGCDAVVFAREVIQGLVKEVSKVKQFLMAVRETSLAWRKNNNEYSDDDFGAGAVDGRSGGIYNNVRVGDLTCRNLKLTDRSTVISVLGPPRLVLQGTCVEKLSPLAEARRILSLNLLDRNEK